MGVVGVGSHVLELFMIYVCSVLCVSAMCACVRCVVTCVRVRAVWCGRRGVCYVLSTRQRASCPSSYHTNGWLALYNSIQTKPEPTTNSGDRLHSAQRTTNQSSNQTSSSCGCPTRRATYLIAPTASATACGAWSVGLHTILLLILIILYGI